MRQLIAKSCKRQQHDTKFFEMMTTLPPYRPVWRIVRQTVLQKTDCLTSQREWPDSQTTHSCQGSTQMRRYELPPDQHSRDRGQWQRPSWDIPRCWWQQSQRNDFSPPSTTNPSSGGPAVRPRNFHRSSWERCLSTQRRPLQPCAARRGIFWSESKQNKTWRRIEVSVDGYLVWAKRTSKNDSSRCLSPILRWGWHLLRVQQSLGLKPGIETFNLSNSWKPTFNYKKVDGLTAVGIGWPLGKGLQNSYSDPRTTNRVLRKCSGHTLNFVQRTISHVGNLRKTKRSRNCAGMDNVKKWSTKEVPSESDDLALDHAEFAGLWWCWGDRLKINDNTWTQLIVHTFTSTCILQRHTW